MVFDLFFYCVTVKTIYRSFSLSRNKKNKSKTIQCKKLRNWDDIKVNEIRHLSKFLACAFPQTTDIRRNVSQKFTEPSMKTPYWCTSVVPPPLKPDRDKTFGGSLVFDFGQ